MTIEMSQCQHGITSGACRFCSRRASTNTLRDAWDTYNSKVGSYDEWSDASHLFYSSGYPTQADYCSIRAIDSLVQIHGKETKTEFIDYNDLGLPLAYILENKIADLNESSERYINETFGLLLELLEIEDQGFEELDELLSAAE